MASENLVSQDSECSVRCFRQRSFIASPHHQLAVSEAGFATFDRSAPLASLNTRLMIVCFTCGVKSVIVPRSFHQVARGPHRCRKCRIPNCWDSGRLFPVRRSRIFRSTPVPGSRYCRRRSPSIRQHLTAFCVEDSLFSMPSMENSLDRQLCFRRALFGEGCPTEPG